MIIDWDHSDKSLQNFTNLTIHVRERNKQKYGKNSDWLIDRTNRK